MTISMQQLITDTFNRRYKLQSLLSENSKHKIFLAKDKITGQLVSIKLLLLGAHPDRSTLRRLEQAAKTLKYLEHPAIPRYLDFFKAETDWGQGFGLVQTYLEAKSLEDWVQAGRSFSEADLKTIAQNLLEILDDLHQQELPLIHQDLQPSNILLGDRSGHHLGQLSLINFGAAQIPQENQAYPNGSTPEKVSEHSLPSSDLHALGATLIFLATGKHPHELPQQSLQSQWGKQTTLSSQFVSWLHWMTAPTGDNRATSARQALSKLLEQVTDDLETNQSGLPKNSQIEVHQMGENFHISRKQQSPDFITIFLILFILVWEFGLGAGLKYHLKQAAELPMILNWTIIACFLVLLIGLLYLAIELIKSRYAKFNISCDRENLVVYWTGSSRFLRGPLFEVRRDTLRKIELVDYSQHSAWVGKAVRLWTDDRWLDIPLPNDFQSTESEWLAHTLSKYLKFELSLVSQPHTSRFSLNRSLEDTVPSKPREQNFDISESHSELEIVEIPSKKYCTGCSLFLIPPLILTLCYGIISFYSHQIFLILLVPGTIIITGILIAINTSQTIKLTESHLTKNKTFSLMGLRYSWIQRRIERSKIEKIELIPAIRSENSESDSIDYAYLQIVTGRKNNFLYHSKYARAYELEEAALDLHEAELKWLALKLSRKLNVPLLMPRFKDIGEVA